MDAELAPFEYLAKSASMSSLSSRSWRKLLLCVGSADVELDGQPPPLPAHHRVQVEMRVSDAVGHPRLGLRFAIAAYRPSYGFESIVQRLPVVE